jgi:D-glycero-D-manno-heptose 1,7-bisphosphate phosphatase
MKAVFLDRDGVINEIVYHLEMGVIDSPFTVRQFTLLPRVPEAIRCFNERGWKVIVVSNQPGIAKKHFTSEILDGMNQKLKRLLKRHSCYVDGIYYCLHHPEAKVARLRKRCDCRKPAAGLLLRAAADWDLDLDASYMIGDGITDIQAGKAAGCRTIFVGNWKCDICRVMSREQVRPDAAARNLWEAMQVVQRWEDDGNPGAAAFPPWQEAGCGS